MVLAAVPTRAEEQQPEAKGDEPKSGFGLTIPVGVRLYATPKAAPNAKAKLDGLASVLQTAG